MNTTLFSVYASVLEFCISACLLAGKEQMNPTLYLQGKPMAAAHRSSFSFMRNDLHGTLQVMLKNEATTGKDSTE
jgi:hypothetical protein